MDNLVTNGAVVIAGWVFAIGGSFIKNEKVFWLVRGVAFGLFISIWIGWFG